MAIAKFSPLDVISAFNWREYILHTYWLLKAPLSNRSMVPPAEEDMRETSLCRFRWAQSQMAAMDDLGRCDMIVDQILKFRLNHSISLLPGRAFRTYGSFSHVSAFRSHLSISLLPDSAFRTYGSVSLVSAFRSCQKSAFRTYGSVRLCQHFAVAKPCVSHIRKCFD